MQRVREILSKEINSVPYQSVYIDQQIGTDTPLFRIRKNTGRIDEIQLFQPINAYRTETRERRRRRRKKISLSHLSTHRRHSQFLKLIVHGLSSLKFQIFLFGILFLSFKFTFSVLFRGGVQLKPNSLNFSFFKHPKLCIKSKSTFICQIFFIVLIISQPLKTIKSPLTCQLFFFFLFSFFF